MTTLYERFMLREARERAHLSVTEAAAWILRNAPSQTAGPRLWRGRGDAANADTCFLMDPSASPRRAENASDVYRALLDYVNPSWPQRSGSLICSAVAAGARGYGTVYGVYVPDSGSFAAINAIDMWLTQTVDISETLNHLWRGNVGFNATPSKWMDDRLRPGYSTAKTTITEIADLNREMEEGRVKWHAHSNGDRQKTTALMHGESPYVGAVFDWLDSDGHVNFADFWKSGRHNLKYSTLGATLHSGADVIGESAGECWTSDTCLLVKQSLIEAVKQEIEMLKRETPAE